MVECGGRGKKETFIGVHPTRGREKKVEGHEKPPTNRKGETSSTKRISNSLPRKRKKGMY